MGLKTGYHNHPQLRRFMHCSDPTGAIASDLHEVLAEGQRHDYNLYAIEDSDCAFWSDTSNLLRNGSSCTRRLS